MSDDSSPLENAHEHKNAFPYAMAEIASRRAIAGLARRRASAAWLTGDGRVQNVNVKVTRVRSFTALRKLSHMASRQSILRQGQRKQIEVFIL